MISQLFKILFGKKMIHNFFLIIKKQKCHFNILLLQLLKGEDLLFFASYYSNTWLIQEMICRLIDNGNTCLLQPYVTDYKNPKTQCCVHLGSMCDL